MKLTFQQLINSLGHPETGDPGALGRFRSAQMPLKTALALKPIHRAIEHHVADYNELRIEICQRHGVINTETNNYEFGENQAAFNKDFAELLLSEITIDSPRIRITQLLSSMAISADDLTLLNWLIDDGSPVEETKPDASDDILDLDEQASTAAAG
jgi:hypothetical protein